MPRQPRLDAPGALHHIMGRGIDGVKIFNNKKDREDFLVRLADLCGSDALSVYAWALMSNHFHLLLRTGAGSRGRPCNYALLAFRSVSSSRLTIRSPLCPALLVAD